MKQFCHAKYRSKLAFSLALQPVLASSLLILAASLFAVVGLFVHSFSHLGLATGDTLRGIGTTASGQLEMQSLQVAIAEYEYFSIRILLATGFLLLLLLALAGVARWIQIKKRCLSRVDQELICVLREITIEKGLPSLLHYQATHDELTGALNRRGLEYCLQNMQTGQQTPFGMVFLDVRRFRYLVKSHGLIVADRLLHAYYGLIYRYLCTNGDIVRFSCDQFLVLQTKPQHWQGLNGALDQMAQHLKSRAIELDGLRTNLQVNIGTIQVPLGPQDRLTPGLIDDLVHEMKYRVCRSADQVVVFDSQQGLSMLNNARLGAQIALDDLPDNLAVHWQPILDTRKENVPIYAEALLRLKQPDGSFLEPGPFLDHCHNRGKTALLDKWVLGQTLGFLNAHAGSLTCLRAVGVNISPSSLNDEQFLEEVLDMLKSSCAACKKICLEITEVGTILDPGSVRDFMNTLRTMGVTLALDDFGAGFSNFQYVLDLRADVIKIDGGIAGQIRKSMENRSVVNAIVNLANDLGCKTVAEWVEDSFALDELRELGVDYVQGFLISHALPPECYLGKRTVTELLDSGIG